MQSSAEMKTYINKFWTVPPWYLREARCNKKRIMYERGHARHNEHCKHEKHRRETKTACSAHVHNYIMNGYRHSTENKRRFLEHSRRRLGAPDTICFGNVCPVTFDCISILSGIGHCHSLAIWEATRLQEKFPTKHPMQLNTSDSSSL